MVTAASPPLQRAQLGETQSARAGLALHLSQPHLAGAAAFPSQSQVSTDLSQQRNCMQSLWLQHVPLAGKEEVIISS